MGIILLALGLQACGGTPAPTDAAAPEGLDQSDPSQVVSTIFEVARGTVPPTVLAQLCDPGGENDLDTRRICDNARGFEPEGEFAMFFRRGKVNGPAVINGDVATVPFLFGPDGDEAELMDLVKKDGKWYLSAF